MKLKLCYYIPESDQLVDTNMIFNFEFRTYSPWLWHMTESNPDTIFFFVVDTTDIPEEAFE